MGSILRPYRPKQRYIPRVTKHEQTLQLECCAYIRAVRPAAIFRSDFASGLHLTQSQATMHKRLQSSRAWPDLTIYEPRTVTHKDGVKRSYCGMAIELKKGGTTIILKTGPRKGRLTSDPHIQEQFIMLKELAKRGWYTNFAVGFGEFEQQFCWYFGIPTNTALF